jgi:ketosteroid isomerase-like protein
MIWHRLLALWLLLPLSSGARSQLDDAAEIRDARLAQNAAIARHDYGAVAQRWADDITVRAGLGISITGRQAHRDAFIAGAEWLIRSELFVATSCTGRACAWPASLP